MAVTKNHSINATLKKAIEYITNPDKTDETLLVYSYGCSPDTADIEFAWTREQARENGGHLARHLIQSFAPGETTPEQAHEIGIALANEVLGGKYEFVLTTHIDRGHIHNHCIFNDVSFADHTRSHVNKKWYYNTRRISDRLCREYGLSVIRPGTDKGKSYIEHAAAKSGTSWKAQLKSTIDKAILRSVDFEDFLLRMELAGYEIKQGKYISFRAKGQERFTRGKTIGTNYTEDSIRDRIKNGRIKKPKTESKRINLIVDIQNSIKAQESKGYEHWAKINNLKQASKTLNFLTEHNISTYEELEHTAQKVHSDFDSVSDKIKSCEKQMNDTAVVIKNLDMYLKLKLIYRQYKNAKNKADFKSKHQSEIILFETAVKELKGTNPPAIDKLKISYTELSDRKAKLYEEYKKLKKQQSEIDTVKSNTDMLLGASHKPEPEKSALLE